MSALTETDLTVLEGLDFAPPCDVVKPCASEAKWAVHGHHSCCGLIVTRIACGAHLKYFMGWLDRTPPRCWACLACGVESKTQLFVIDQIEAL